MERSKEQVEVARRVLTYLEVQAAADSVVADGLNATVRAVYEKLEFGSFATIGKMLNRWKAERPAKEAQEGERISQESADSLARDIQRAIDRSTADLRMEFLNVRKDYDELLDQASETEIECEQLRKEGVKLTKESSVLLEKLDRVSAQAVSAKEELTSVSELVENQRTELATCRAGHEIQQQSLVTLQRLVEQKDNEAAQALSRATKAEQGEAVALAKKEAAEAAVSKLETHSEQQIILAGGLQKRIDVLQEKLDAVIQSASSEARDHAVTVSRLNEQLHLEHMKNAELCSELDSMRDTMAAVDIKRPKSKKKIEDVN